MPQRREKQRKLTRQAEGRLARVLCFRVRTCGSPCKRRDEELTEKQHGRMERAPAHRQGGHSSCATYREGGFSKEHNPQTTVSSSAEHRYGPHRAAVRCNRMCYICRKPMV